MLENLQPIQHQLTKLARNDLFTLLSQTNTLSTDHRGALTDVLGTYSRLALMGEDGRQVRAFPLSMGLGKTQSVASWCYAVHQLQLDDISVLVCGEQLEDLDKLRSEMILRGIDPDRIGFIHRVGKRKGLTEASSGSPGDYQFLLVSHQMVRCTAEIRVLNQFQGNERSLCIWDESLVRNDGGYITAQDVERTLAASRIDVQGHFSNSPEHDSQKHITQALAYARKGLERIKSEYDRQKLHNKEPQPITDLPEFNSETREEYRQAINRQIKRKDDRRILTKFLELCQSDLRVNLLPGAGGSGEGVISFIPKVPRDLKRLVVLDASCMIRELTRMDSSIEVVERWSRVKTFENVSVTQYADFKGGWHSLSKLRRNSELITHIVDLVKSIPHDECILICSKKSSSRTPGPIDKIKEALIDSGINLDEPDTQQARDYTVEKRFNFITWGRHKATSQYSHCKHIIAVGVLRRDQLELSSAMAAQAEDVMDSRVSCADSVRRVLRSEQFYCLQQLIGRGPARKSVNGIANESQVYVYDQEDFGELIQEGLPGIRWEVFKKICRGSARANTKTADTAVLIRDYLSQVPGEVLKMTIRKLKDDLRLDISQKVFQCARDLALRDSAWRLQTQSLIRT